MALTLPTVLLEVFVLLGILISIYTIHLENEIDKHSSCVKDADCKTCDKLPSEFTGQCVDGVCWGRNRGGFMCKGRPNGEALPNKGGECWQNEHWKQCPEYVAMCDLGEWSKCSKVFTSPWSHILVHWGIAKEGSALDLTLPKLGMFWFLVLMVYPVLHRAHPLVPTFFSLLGVGSLCFNGYLGWVLKTKLKEFCIVCFSTYVVNGSSVLCIWADWRSNRAIQSKIKDA